MSFDSHMQARARCLVIAALAGAAAGCSAAVEPVDGDVSAVSEALCVPDVPPDLVVEAGNKLAFKYDAVGQQIYTCKAGTDGAYSWTLLAPDAHLLGKHGRIAGSHYAGPTWESIDGSTVVGARRAGVTVDPTAIAWLKLEAVSHTGSGRMSEVTWIQRLYTTAGLAPTTGCDADHGGATASADYTAVYYFYEAKPGSSKH